MARTTRYHYTVTGRGRFPFDMLRYDQAWPEDGGMSMGGGNGEDSRERREQRLIGLNPPTADRWASFGWYVVRESVDKRTF